MQPLTTQERRLLEELVRLAGTRGVVTGRDLLDHGFAEFAVQVYGVDVSYPQSLPSRKLQILRDKGYIKMERKGGGTYTILNRP
jgi:hypothetical protein